MNQVSQVGTLFLGFPALCFSRLALSIVTLPQPRRSEAGELLLALGARGPFLSWTHEQHLAGPSGSEHPSGWLHRATAFLFAAKSSLSFLVPQHARAADDEASWSLARYTAPGPCQGEPERWHQRRAAGWELGVVTQRRF